MYRHLGSGETGGWQLAHRRKKHLYQNIVISANGGNSHQRK